MKKTTRLFGLMFLVVSFWFLPSVGHAADAVVDCDKIPTPDSLQDAIDAAIAQAKGYVIDVSGTCKENVIIRYGKVGIILDGHDAATIQGQPGSELFHTVTVFGRGNTIRGFTITGADLDGIGVGRGGSATIDHNVIQNNGRFGIDLFDNAFAIIINNIVEGNMSHGILVDENSSARIGFENFIDTVAQSNTIQGNGSIELGGSGVVVIRSSSAVIVGNTIRDNVEDGIRVVRASHADIAHNHINSNHQNGILVSQNSGVNLGSDAPSPATIFDSFNFTGSTLKNTKKGIVCSIGAYVDGRRGTLNGLLGVGSYTTGCTNSTIP
jgi:parallel beta-helix repeat protein